MIFPSCKLFTSDGFNLNSWGDTSDGINEVDPPVFPITAFTKAFIGCIVVITPFVSEANTAVFEIKSNVIIVNSLFIRSPLKYILQCYNITLY